MAPEVIGRMKIVPQELFRFTVLERAVSFSLFGGEQLMHDLADVAPFIVVRHKHHSLD